MCQEGFWNTLIIFFLTNQLLSLVDVIHIATVNSWLLQILPKELVSRKLNTTEHFFTAQEPDAISPS